VRDDVAVTADVPTILATSAFFRRGGYGAMSLRPGAIHYLAADQATGDPETRIGAFYAAFAGTEFTMSHLQLFPMPNVEDIRAHILAQDIVWVDGGSVANLVALWRVHGVDEILHEAWQAGVVMSGVSAGSICWHQGGSTDSYGLELRGFTDGLGWLPYSNGVHYDAEEQRRPKMHELIGDGTLGDGYATDDGAGLVYRGTTLAEAVADREGPLGYSLKRAEGGEVVETPLPTRVLSVG
jgi:peptidase E